MRNLVLITLEERTTLIETVKKALSDEMKPLWSAVKH